MEFSINQEQFLYESVNNTADDWAFIEKSTNLKMKANPQNMLQSLSNNLIAYENSYKKDKNRPKFYFESSEHLKKRKVLKRKLNFTSDLSIIQKIPSSFQNDKENRIQTINLHETIEGTSKQKILTKQFLKDDSGSNLIKLDKMFKIMKDFNTLNESILPFKVNLNKVSHKRILASMAFQQFTLQHQQDSTIPNGKKMEKQSTATLETEYIPIKRRMYSFDTREKQPLAKEKIKIDSSSISNLIFTINRQDFLEFQKKSKPISRRKRSYSVRKPQNYIVEKSIEQIRHNYSRLEKDQFQRNNCKLEQKRDLKGKDYDKFSDSRFFLKKSKANNLTREGLSEISVSGLINLKRK